MSRKLAVGTNVNGTLASRLFLVVTCKQWATLSDFNGFAKLGPYLDGAVVRALCHLRHRLRVLAKGWGFDQLGCSLHWSMVVLQQRGQLPETALLYQSTS